LPRSGDGYATYVVLISLQSTGYMLEPHEVSINYLINSEAPGYVRLADSRGYLFVMLSHYRPKSSNDFIMFALHDVRYYI